jgi:hypothetical protein
MSKRPRRDAPKRTKSPRPSPAKAPGGKKSAVTILGRPAKPTGRSAKAHALPDRLLRAIRRDAAAPPPLLLLPLRLEYRVVDVNIPIRMAGNAAAIFSGAKDISVKPQKEPWSKKQTRKKGAVPRFRLNPATVTLTTQRQIWFRWYPDEDFTLHGIAPPSKAEREALKRFDAACAGADWYKLDDAAVLSAWQVLSRDVAPERALHLIRHRSDAGDPNHLDALGRITLLPEHVALFALNERGSPTLLGEGEKIDQKLRYSMANLQAGGWHTDFDAALEAGMGLRLTTAEAVERALNASWIIAVGISKGDGAAAMTTLLDDAIANGAFSFLQQDTATNNTPQEPTPFQSPRANLGVFLKTAVEAEKGVLGSRLTQSAELFAEAIGVELPHVATAPMSGDLAFEEARAMLRVVGPALIDTSVRHTDALRGVSDEDVINYFERYIASRGPLPPVRFGKNPYGVLPLINLSGLEALASDTEEAKSIEAFVREFAAIVVIEAGRAADSAVPILRPGDPDAELKLEAILKLNPVSRRLEVRTVDTSVSKALACPYITSRQHRVQQYLIDLAQDPIQSLPDPTAGDPDWPLLYRLARLSLSSQTLFEAAAGSPALASVPLNTRFHLATNEKTNFDLASSEVARNSLASLASKRIPGLGKRAASLQRVSVRLFDALTELQRIARKPGGVAKLETLLMETIDLFQYRIDAWATGLAYRRLVRRRRAGRDGLVGGYWGLLGKLNVGSFTGRTDGYLQAPSPHQAATAAILRSAHLRHGATGPFAIGLDSARVRRGLKLLDMLQAGITPGEALGYIAERKLHDGQQDILIFRLRELFPLRDPRDDEAIETRLNDGLAFLNANIASMVPAEEAAPLLALQDYLRQEFDALADIVVAEATHLRTMGRTDAANAWLQVLSGETIPGHPSVLRTRRTGHGSTHRLVVLIEPVRPDNNATPRAIAEPALALLATTFLNNFDTAVVEVTIASADSSPAVTLQFKLAADLGLAPIDALVGGESEVILRARHRLITLWRDDEATRAQLGPLPDSDIVTYINQTRPVTVDLDAGQPSARALISRAAELRRAVAQGRMLEPTDLSAAADPAIKLTDERERDLLANSSDALGRRASILADRLNASLAALRSAAGPVVAAARNYRRLVEDGAEASALFLALAELNALRRVLDTELLAVSRFSEPAALRPIATGEMTADPDALERGLASVAARLSAKAEALAAAVPPSARPANTSDARARRDALVAALKAALDGEAQPILPPLQRVEATTPLIKPSPPRVAPSLAEWTAVRSNVARIASLFADLPWRAYATSDEATSANDPDADERPDEGLAPRARLFGTFVSINNPAAAGTFTGFMADEWAEQRPSRMQQTGIAINYDSPQSEPPNVLLLCEPTGPSAEAWSPSGAAVMMAEAIGLMKVRALTAQDHPLPGPLLPFANQVAYKQVAAEEYVPRIPVRQIKRVPDSPELTDAGFVVDASTSGVGVAGSGLSETSGFIKVQE